MAIQMAASHAASRILKDAIFGAAAACRTAAAVHGEENVVNATIGAVMDDAGKLAHLPTVERVLRTTLHMRRLPDFPSIWKPQLTSPLPGTGRMAFWEPLQLPAVRARFVRP